MQNLFWIYCHSNRIHSWSRTNTTSKKQQYLNSPIIIRNMEKKNRHVYLTRPFFFLQLILLFCFFFFSIFYTYESFSIFHLCEFKIELMLVLIQRVMFTRLWLQYFLRKGNGLVQILSYLKWYKDQFSAENAEKRKPA